MSWDHRFRNVLAGMIGGGLGLEQAHLHASWGLPLRADLATVLGAVPYEVDREMTAAATALLAAAQGEPTAEDPRSFVAAQVRADLVDRSFSLTASGLRTYDGCVWAPADPRRTSSLAAYLTPALLGDWRSLGAATSQLFEVAGGRLEWAAWELRPHALFADFLARLDDPGRAAGLTMIALAGEVRHDERIPITDGERAYVLLALDTVTMVGGITPAEYAERHTQVASARTRAELVQPLLTVPRPEPSSPYAVLARFPLGKAVVPADKPGLSFRATVDPDPAAVTAARPPGDPDAVAVARTPASRRRTATVDRVGAAMSALSTRRHAGTLDGTVAPVAGKPGPTPAQLRRAMRR